MLNLTEKVLRESQEWKDWINPEEVIQVADLHRELPDAPAYRTFIVITKDEYGYYTITRFFPMGEKLEVSVDHKDIEVDEVFHFLLTQYSRPLN